MFKFATTAIDANALRAALNDDRAGAVSTFEGMVRNHNEGKAVTRLEYEAYESLAVKEAERILEEARQQFGVFHVVCVHRVGSLAIGDMAVWVGCSAAHRDEAFKACRYVIDEIKARLPIWKKEHYVDGVAEWVNCQHAAAPEACCSDEPKHKHKHQHVNAMHAPENPDELDILDLSTADLHKFVIVDIREPYEDPSHVLRSLLRMDVQEWPLSTFAFEKPPIESDKKYLFVCGHGVRTKRLVDFLREKGFQNVYSLIGGFEAVRRKFIA